MSFEISTKNQRTLRLIYLNFLNTDINGFAVDIPFLNKAVRLGNGEAICQGVANNVVSLFRSNTANGFATAKGDVKFADRTVSEQVDAVLNGEDTVSTHLRILEHTPQILLDLGVLFKAHRWYLKQEHQDSEIKELKNHHNEDVRCLKEENTLICFALSACLDGLQQLGANHTVPTAKEKLDKYLNKQAHK